jgi:2-keto-4-pentenoate hydratase/2-oxohepta-3-ene-1,7-dioic acid hydratase in catechol pathway
MGPCLVTPDELDHPDDLELGCQVNGAVMQQGRTSDMIFPVSELVAYLSGIVTLYPGDIIFTGTPSGVGMGRTPPVYLQAGDVLQSWIEGIGTLTQTFVAADSSKEV